MEFKTAPTDDQMLYPMSNGCKFPSFWWTNDSTMCRNSHNGYLGVSTDIGWQSRTVAHIDVVGFQEFP